jgi:hypothetical protein
MANGLSVIMEKRAARRRSPPAQAAVQPDVKL